ncbi:hypothetical protein BGZ76_011434 [Entomortierella beljakovae]|nr:hypothetical protein BGZ76_011434 [Entomortierella beljakovae]
MKGAHQTEVISGEDNLEWIEQHHRNTSRRSLHSSQTFDSNPSGDESDSAEMRRQSQFYVSDPQKRTKSYHIDQSIQAIQLLKDASKPTGWKKVAKHKSGCLVYQSTNNADKHPAFKGEHVIRGYRAQDVFSVVGVRKLWDDWYDELSCVESYDDATNLMYMVMKGTLSSKTRDISMVERIEVERDGTIYFASCSVESDKIPRISGKVRADIFVAGWIIQPLPSNPPITKITYVIQTDLLSRLPKFIARRSLAKRPLVITTIETHLKKNGIPMVMSNLVSQTTNRHRSLSEPLKPEKFLYAEPEQEENVLSGSAFLSPMGPITSEKDIEHLNDKDEFGEDDMHFSMSSATEGSTTRNSMNSLAPSTISGRSLAPSIFTSEFLENNKVLGDTALFGDSKLFGKGGIYENTVLNKEETSATTCDDHVESSSPMTPQSQNHKHQLSSQTAGSDQRPPPPYRSTAQTPSTVSESTRNANQSGEQSSDTPHVVTPVTPPLTPTTSIDGKDAPSDSDAPSSPNVKIVPRVPKQRALIDSSLPARPSSMMFAAYGMKSPSDIMESRRHSSLIGRSSSFAPRHSHVIPLRGSSSFNLNGSRAGSVSPLANSTKRHSTAPSLDSNRSLTLMPPAAALPHRHSETARKALAMFKVLASSPEDRWRAVSSEGPFKSYSRVISGAGLPMLRGEGVITGGWTVEQINAVIESSGCRQIWDERFETMSIAETFNSNEYLYHVSLQGVGSLTGRDLAGVAIIDRDPTTSALYNVSTSVLDPTIPEDPGRIRALLELSGWSLRPVFDSHGNTISVNVTFVIQIDIRGTLPNSVVKLLTASMMTAVPRLNHFVNKSGYPPYASQISGTRLLDTFDPKTGFYELCYKTAPGWTEVRVGRKVYKDGYDFFIKPDDPTVRVELAPDFGGVRIWTTLDHEGQSITAQVSRKGQNPTRSTKQQLLQLQQEEEEDEISGAGRYNRDSFVPQRPRDSRVFESSSPTFGGASLRKTPSHLKSNDQNQNTDKVNGGSSTDTGNGSDLGPQRTSSSSSVGRKRRSASFSTLSTFDPNLIVASSSERPADETPQTSMTPMASQESERSRSRSRTPRSLASMPPGTPPPPPPRRSSSLGRHSIPIPAYPQDNAPPVPTKSSITSPTFGNPPSSVLDIPTPATSAITISTAVSTQATISSPLSSPTLGPFHVPHHPIKFDSSFNLDSSASSFASDSNINLESSLSKKASPTASSQDALYKQSTTKSQAVVSTNAAFSSSPEIVLVSLDDFETKTVNAFSLDEHLGSTNDSTSKSIDKVVEGSISNEAVVVSLSIDDSTPLIPLPDHVKTGSTASRCKPNDPRHVTFSPDTVDTPENRPPLHRIRKSKSSRKGTSSGKIPPPKPRLQFKGVNPEIEEVEPVITVDEVTLSKEENTIPVSAVDSRQDIISAPDVRDFESDEEEFVEATTDLMTTDIKEKIITIAAATDKTLSEQKIRPMMEMNHLLDDEEIWQTATLAFIEELRSTQSRLAAIFVLLIAFGTLYT